MNRIVIASIAATTLSISAATAADIARPVYKAMPAAAPFSWTGLYLGGHAGYGWSDTDVGIVTNPPLLDISQSSLRGDGAVAGAQIGYNWQFAPNWVAGIEADLSGTGIDDLRNVQVTAGGVALDGSMHNLRYSIDWTASLRGRFGYAWDRSLLYVTGGFAWAGARTGVTTTIGAIVDGRTDEHLSGWTLGGGYEWAFAPNWSARIEYLHYSFDGFGTQSVTLGGGPITTANTWGRPTLDVVRLGVNYRFGDAGGPAAAPIVKAAPAAFAWTGFYLGGHAGYGWTDNAPSVAWNLPAAFDTQALPFNMDGIVGGAQIGYNWQIAPAFVAGFEADLSGTGLNGTASNFGTTGGVPNFALYQTASYDIAWLASARARLGYAWDRSLLYVTGGFAWAGVKADVLSSIPGNAFPGSFSDTVSGWALGGGYEWAFAPNWSARVEYLHYDLDGVSHGVSPTPPIGLATTASWERTRLDVVRAGVNYRFGAY